MKCLLCDKYLCKGEADGFVCICDECYLVLEKQEVRFVEKICDQRKELKDIYESDHWYRHELG